MDVCPGGRGRRTAWAPGVPRTAILSVSNEIARKSSMPSRPATLVPRYRLSRRAHITEHHDLAVATAAVPRSVVCLISALRFHHIGTQLPAEVWMAVPRGMRVPRVSAPPLRLVNVSTAVFDLGLEEHRIEGQAVRIFSLARTAAD